MDEYKYLQRDRFLVRERHQNLLERIKWLDIVAVDCTHTQHTHPYMYPLQTE